jgi:predicted RNase H-like nuclease
LSPGGIRYATPLALPQIANFSEAAGAIAQWRSDTHPQKTIVLLGQPTIVPNDKGQRPVENLTASAVSLRHGGMQPTSKSRDEMFGPQAPVWAFLERFGGMAAPP